MKIVLVKCRYFDKEAQTFWTHVLPPHGLAILASCVMREGHTCAIYDMEALRASWRDLRKYLLKEKPDVVGFEVQTPLFHKAQHGAKVVREVLPKALLLAGGAHTFLEPEHTLREIPEVDYVLRGEAEFTLPLFLKRYGEGKRGGELTDIDGCCYREREGYHISKEVPLQENLDELPLPAFHLLPLKRYYDAFYPSKRLYDLLSARGCPHYCKFCGEPVIYGHRVRARSPGNVVDHMEVLVRDYGVDYIVFQDATFNYSVERVKNLCREILRRDVRVKWKVKARVDQVDEEMLRLMKKAGCIMIAYGAEAASDCTLRFLRKGFTVEQVRRAFSLTRKTGVDTLGYFMLGAEGETEKDLKDTIDFSIELAPTYAHYMITTPMYGSDLQKYYKEQLKHASLKGYLFFTAMVDTDMLNRETIKRYHRKAHIDFYLRPSYIVGRIICLRGPKDLWLKIKYGLFMILKMLWGKGWAGESK